MDDDLALSTLLASRALHDLAGPIGSAFNAAEMAEEAAGDADLLESAVALATDAARRGRDRLEILRAALGRPGDGYEALDAVRGAIAAAARSAGATMEWDVVEEPAAPSVRALLASSVLLALETAPRTKSLWITVSPGEIGFEGVITAEGAPIRPREQSLAVLENRVSIAEADPRGAFAASATRWAAAAGGAVRMETEEGAVSVRWTARTDVDA